ncbi:MAG: sensor histidine kinase [Lachnospiraceae bacterium]|jgi:two-component system sensor histidine kinase YesM|nr:sensor histidine kinase [Lachnospiraceae bacterium]
MKIREIFRGLKLNIKFTVVIIIAIMIPIAIFAGVLFYNIEQNAVETNKANMEYRREQSVSNINNCINSINMATQFFLSDEEMKEVLVRAKMGDELTNEELVAFKNTDIRNLERLVSNNPLLYSVRIFAAGDNVQEMMQILYKNKRSLNLGWRNDVNRDGWHFGVTDMAFSALLTNTEDSLACLVTPMSDYRAGEIGIVEASVKMSTLFPSLFENNDSEWNVFIADDGNIYSAGDLSDEQVVIIRESFERWKKAGESVDYHKGHSEKLVTTVLYRKELGGSLVFVKDITGEIEHIYGMRSVFIVMMIILLIAISFFINRIVQAMLRQFYSILKSMREVGHGNLSVRVENPGNDEMGELGTQLNTMLDRIENLMKENIGREVMVKDSEIRALQNQINAHFIYNVLESIKMMAEIDEEYEISDSITSLGKLLRYSMRWVSGNVSVEDELEYIKNYIALINLRYDFTVNLSVNVPENLMEQQIPKMSLQPIVENAILHGIEPLGVDSTIYIKATTDGKDAIVEVTDSGQGMSAEELEKLNLLVKGELTEVKEKSNGIGLHNVQKRIKMTFGEEYGMTISAAKDCYTKVSIRVPYRKSEG